MLFRFVVASLLLAPLTAAAAGHVATLEEPSNTSVLTVWQQASAIPPSTLLAVGDDAPGFSYLGSDGGWHKFSQLAARQPVLLVFGANESELEALDHARPQFLDLGIVPIAVVDRRVGTAKAMRRRLNLSCPVIGDPMRAIADLYNSLDRNHLGHAPSYFVLDETHTIRAMGRGELPAVKDLLDTSARGLGRVHGPGWSATSS